MYLNFLIAYLCGMSTLFTLPDAWTMWNAIERIGVTATVVFVVILNRWGKLTDLKRNL